MGDKSTARETMKKAGVPTVPGSDGLLQVLHVNCGVVIFDNLVQRCEIKKILDNDVHYRAQKKL